MISPNSLAQACDEDEWDNIIIPSQNSLVRACLLDSIWSDEESPTPAVSPNTLATCCIENGEWINSSEEELNIPPSNNSLAMACNNDSAWSDEESPTPIVSPNTLAACCIGNGEWSSSSEDEVIIPPVIEENWKIFDSPSSFSSEEGSFNLSDFVMTPKKEFVRNTSGVDEGQGSFLNENLDDFFNMSPFSSLSDIEIEPEASTSTTHKRQHPIDENMEGESVCKQPRHNQCNWCGQHVELVPGKAFCMRCASHGKECNSCHRPMPARFYQAWANTCSACYKKKKKKKFLL